MWEVGNPVRPVATDGAGHEAKRRRLARSVRPEQNESLAVSDDEFVDVDDRLINRPTQMLEAALRHRLAPVIAATSTSR